MRVITCVALMAMLSVPVIASSQKVSFTGRNVPFKTVIHAIQQQTGYSFVYNKALLSAVKPFTISVTDVPLETFLEQLLEGTSLSSRIDNGTVILSRKAPAAADMLASALPQPDTTPKVLVTGVVMMKDPYALSQPLAGATVLEKGTRNAVVTDEKGAFAINARVGSTLEISHVSTELLTVKVPEKPARLRLEAQVKESGGGEDLVVTGYYTRKKESFTGASTTITRKELMKFNNNNIFSVIQSIDPSFQLQDNIETGSNPNQLPELNIRGISNVGSTVNAPLIIIDGFQASLQQLYDMDVNRIESISILKDASATILYGSRGGNGVVVIETRLPKAGKFTVSYDFKPSVSLVDLSDYNLMNATQKVRYEELAGVYDLSMNNINTTDPYWLADYQMKLDNLHRDRLLALQEGVNTYWLSKPVQSTLSTAHSIRAEGGGQDVRYSIDGSYNDYKGAIKESGRKRYGAAFNLIYRVPEKIIVRNNASFLSTHEYNSPYGSFSLYARLNPYERIYDANGEMLVTYNDLGQFSTSLLGGEKMYNPLYNARLPYKDYLNTSVLTNNLTIEWFLNRNFKLNATGIVAKSFVDGEVYTSPYNTRFLTEEDPLKRGSYTIRNGGGMQVQTNLNLQYSNSFGAHAVTANVIGEMKSADDELTTYSLTGFVDDRFISPSLALQYKENSRPDYSSVPERLVGLASNLHYNYDQRYLADFSYRVDGSSKFGSRNRYGSFWSFGVGYNLHREAFIDPSVFSVLRFFANIGETGNENFTADMTSTAYTFNSTGYYFKKNSADYVSQGNSFLTWPKVLQKSAGIDAAFWNKRANLRLNFYERTTNRMISAITVAPSMGFADNRIYENMGEVRNAGFELSTSVMVYANRAKEFYWNVNVSAVKNTSKLKKISDELRKLNETLVVKDDDGNIVKPTSYYEENQSLSVFRGARSLGIDPASGRELFLTRSGDRSFVWNADDQVVIGDKEPDLRGTFGTDLAFKGLSVQAIFLYSLGGDIYNSTLVSKIENASPFGNVDLRVLEQRWVKPGDVTLFKGITDQTITQMTSRFVQKENYMRLSSLNINYEFGKEKLKKYRIQRLRLNFSTNDLFRISTVKMERGIDYPFARTYNMGLMVEY